MFQQPIQYNGKYKFILKDDGPFATGLMPQFMRDQTSNDYDININVPIDPSKLEKNTATLQITDGVLDSVLQLENGILNLPNDSESLNQATRFTDNGKGYATAVSIDLTNLTYYSSMPKIDNGNDGDVIPINENNVEITLLDEDNDRTDIEHTILPYDPNPTKRSIKAVNLSKDNNMRDITAKDIVGYIRVNIPPPKINSPTTNNGFYKFNDSWNALTEGSSEDHDLIIQVPNSTETLTVTQNNQTYTPSQGNVGFHSVAVQVPEPSVESTKTINITENKTTIVTPSSSYDSIGQLEIITAIPSNVNNQTLTTITSNGTYTPDSGYSGFNSFTVNVPQPSIQQNKSITLNSNSTVTIRPDNNYDALDEITITTEVPTTDTVINNQNVNSNNLITRNGFYAPDSQHTGFNAFTVAIPLQKDKNINVNGKIGQTIVWTPDAGYAGFEKSIITVIPPAYQTKTITSNGTYTPDSNYDGFSSVTVNVPSSGIQANKIRTTENWDNTDVNFSDFIYVPDLDDITTINNHHYLGIEQSDNMYNFVYFIGNDDYPLDEPYWWYDFTANNKHPPSTFSLVYNNTTVVGTMNLTANTHSGIRINKALIAGLPTGGSDEPDEPDEPVGPVQPVLYATTCELVDPTGINPGRQFSFNSFNLIDDEGGMVGPEPEEGDQYDCFLIIEENSTHYKFSIQKGGFEVNTHDSIHAWYKMYTEYNYPNNYLTYLYIPSESATGSRFNGDLEGSNYFTVSKDELVLDGLPVN